MENMNNEAREIPYWKNILVNCPNCWFKWEPAKYRKWNIFLEIILWLLFLIPWAIYTALRHINTFCLCPKCKQKFLLETDWDNNLIDMLCKIRKKQLCWFWVIVVGFSILWMASISWIYKSYQKSIIENNRTYNYQQNNTYVEPQKVDEQKNEEEVKVEKPKDPNEETREKMKSILSEIDRQYWNIDSYIWASCVWDCINWIINIKFSENIWRYDFTVKAHQADWSNKIIREIPGAFEKIQIDFICKWKTISSCVFTEYQINTYTPKGCTYYWYSD